MQLFANIIDRMKDRSPETMAQRNSDLETITTMKNAATYAGFTTAALTVTALVATVAYPCIFGVLAVGFTAFLTLVGRDISVFSHHIEEAFKTDLDFGVGHEIKTARTAKAFFNAVAKNSLIIGPILKFLRIHSTLVIDTIHMNNRTIAEFLVEETLIDLPRQAVNAFANLFPYDGPEGPAPQN